MFTRLGKEHSYDNNDVIRTYFRKAEKDQCYQRQFSPARERSESPERSAPGDPATADAASEASVLLRLQWSPREGALRLPGLRSWPVEGFGNAVADVLLVDVLVEHTASLDALAQGIEGEAEITVAGKPMVFLYPAHRAPDEYPALSSTIKIVFAMVLPWHL